MFKASVTYKKGEGLSFSNTEKSFTNLFDTENLEERMAAFDQDEVTIVGQVLPETPLKFVVDWASFNGVEVDLPDALAMSRYLKLTFNTEIFRRKE